LDLSFDKGAFSGHVPLFPLPGTVLLPGALLPLHIFEPRYRAMVQDAVQGERLIAMALLGPGYEEEYEGAPAIEEHVCIGRIVLEEALPDGRWNILLVGLRRARVVDEDRSRAYRLARVDVLEDDPLDEASERRLMIALRSLLEAVPEQLVRDASRRELVLGILRGGDQEGLPMGMLVDLAADLVHLGALDRQQLLGLADVEERVERLTRLLRHRASQLDEARRSVPWPPKFSRN
jgi:uncharacterized protein